MVEVPISFNQREIIVPFFRVGVPEFAEGQLVGLWESLRDFRGKKGKNDGE